MHTPGRPPDGARGGEAESSPLVGYGSMDWNWTGEKYKTRHNTVPADGSFHYYDNPINLEFGK